MRRILLFITISVGLIGSFSCKKEISPVTEDDNAIIAPVGKPNGVLFLGTLVDSVKYIQLENSDEAIISQISNVSFDDGFIFIHDVITASVLIFDDSGKYLTRISRIGKGPGEYIKLNSLMVNTENKELVVYDTRSRKLIFYDYEGNCLREIHQFSEGAILRDIINLPNGHFLCYRGDYSNGRMFDGLWETDSNGVVINHLMKQSRQYPIHSNGNNLFQKSETVYGLMSQENEVYYYDYVSGDFHKHLSYDIEGKSVLDFPDMLQTPENYVSAISTHEKNGYLLTEWLDENVRYFTTLYSHTNQEMQVYGPLVFEDADGMIGEVLESNLTDALVVAVAGERLKRYLADNRGLSPEVIAQINTFVAGMSDHEIDDMNPILEIMYVKKN